MAEWIFKTRYLFYGYGRVQGRREVGGGPGQIFFRGPSLKIFSGVSV